jgi:hypothetical protein
MTRHHVTMRQGGRVRTLVVFGGALAVLVGLTIPLPANAVPPPTSAVTAPSHPTPATAAVASMRARATGKSIVADALTTPTSRTTANPNGSYTRTDTAVPVRLERAGGWVDLDPTLHANPGGTVSPNATTGDVTLSGGGTGPFVTLLGAAHQVSLTLPMSLPTPTLFGNTATYADVFPSVDLVATVDAQGGVSDVFVVRNATAAGNPALKSLRITTATQGLIVSGDATGNLTFNDQTGAPVYSASAPIMWDSAPMPANVTTTGPTGQQTDAQTGLPVASSTQAPAEQAHRASVGVSVSSDTIVLTPASALLTTSTAYPVYIDPTISFHPDSFGGTADWTEIESGFPNQPGWHQHGLEQVGFCGWDGCNGIGVTRSLFQFSTGPLRGTNVISAQFNVTDEYAPACPAGGQGNVTMDLFFTNSTINSGTDWNNQPGHSGDAIGSSSTMHGYDSACPAAGIGFDITNPLKSVLGHLGGVIGFELRADDENNKFGWKELSDTATWSTTYDVIPATPFNPTPSPATGCTSSPANSVIGNTDLTLSIDTAKASDGIAKPLNVDLRVTNSANGGTVSDHTILTTAGAWASVTLAQGTLPNGNYTWSAQASDGLLSSSRSTTCAFRVDTSQPGPPSINPTGPSTCTTSQCSLPVRTPITVTFGAAPGSTTSSYRYQINSGLPVTVTASGGSWSGTITPKRIGPNVLTVQALSSAGTPSTQAARLVVTATPPVTPDLDGDLTGDGKPDLLTVGNINGTPPGLLLSPGKGDGSVGSPSDIGINGAGLATAPGRPTDWNGAIIAHGQFSGDGMQDVLAVFPPDSAGDPQNAEFYEGSGDGSALDVASGDETIFSVQGQGCFTDTFRQCLTTDDPMKQVTAMGHLPEDTCDIPCTSAYPDLFSVVTVDGEGQLWWYQSQNDQGGYDKPVVLDSSIDWTTKQITGTAVAGQPALEVRDTSTGEVDVYTTNAADDENTNWFITATKATMLATSSATGTGNAANAVDANNDGNPDLWTTHTTGTLTYYQGNASHTLGTAANGGAVVPTTKAISPFGATTWHNPVTGTSQTDIYYTLDTSGTLWDSQETAAGLLGPPTVAMIGWTHYRRVGVADANHDGYPDLVAIDTNAGSSTADDEVMFSGSATGLSPTPIVWGTGWTSIYTMYGLADWNHDGHVDTIATDTSGAMWEYPGDPTGGVGARVQIGTDWTSAFSPFGISDVTGDGHFDILTCVSGTLRLYLGDDTGGAGPRDTVATGCQNQAAVGLTDYDGDNQPDLIVQDTTTHAITVNPGPGALGSFAGIGTSIGTVPPTLTPYGSVNWTNPATGNHQIDIVAADSNGNLLDYTEQPGGQLSDSPATLATNWTHYRPSTLADMNHDGYPDVIAIDTSTTDSTANDELVFTRSAGGLSSTPVVLGPGWTSDLIPYGLIDWTHNGHYGSLALQASTGNMYFFPGDLTGGGGARITVATGWGRTWTSIGTGDVTSDGNPDILTCRDDISTLLDYPGTATGGTGTIGTVLNGCDGVTPFGMTDYDGDGKLDVIAYDKATQKLVVDHGAGNGWFTPNPTIIGSGW